MLALFPDIVCRRDPLVAFDVQRHVHIVKTVEVVKVVEGRLQVGFAGLGCAHALCALCARLDLVVAAGLLVVAAGRCGSVGGGRRHAHQGNTGHGSCYDKDLHLSS
jgi:hypothetical protein